MNRSDNFNRADDALAIGAPSDGGSPWIAEMTGDAWGIFSNRAAHYGSVFPSIATLESSEPDVDVEATINPAFNAFGLAFRVADENNYLILYIDGGQQQLVKVEAGTPLALDTYTGSMTAGDVFRVRATGTALEGYQNGTLRVNATETFNQMATRHGLYNDNAASTSTNYDDFSITALGAGGPTTATISGPTTGEISTESTAFTVTLNAPSVGTTTISLASTDGGDVFHAISGGSSVTSIVIADGQTTGTFYLLPDSTIGARTITPTTSGITFTPTSLTYTTTPPALVAGTASFVSSGPGGVVVSATDASGGTAPYTYQWQRNSDGGSYSNLTNGGGVSGATTLELTDGSAVEGVLYGYRLVYTDSDLATATSNVAPPDGAEVYSGGPLTGGGNTYSRGRLVNNG